ncbi:hypothetical protein EYF80_022484 [Liparis tanakae]|uniref:Uncharacterized protein n=1 Tax=Liparis tanakae TaxID=230148 RepID=A0A4Z2HNM5_9TELE|nr:hypothetical protein EYF80_022484 [Liparis tanakae]
MRRIHGRGRGNEGGKSYLSNQCLSRSPFALMPRDTPPRGRREEGVSHGRTYMCHFNRGLRSALEGINASMPLLVSDGKAKRRRRDTDRGKKNVRGKCQAAGLRDVWPRPPARIRASPPETSRPAALRRNARTCWASSRKRHNVSVLTSNFKGTCRRAEQRLNTSKKEKKAHKALQTGSSNAFAGSEKPLASMAASRPGRLSSPCPVAAPVEFPVSRSRPGRLQFPVSRRRPGRLQLPVSRRRPGRLQFSCPVAAPVDSSSRVT